MKSNNADKVISVILKVIAGLTVIIGFILGIALGNVEGRYSTQFSFPLALAYWASGFISALIIFAISRIMDMLIELKGKMRNIDMQIETNDKVHELEMKMHNKDDAVPVVIKNRNVATTGMCEFCRQEYPVLYYLRMTEGSNVHYIKICDSCIEKTNCKVLT